MILLRTRQYMADSVWLLSRYGNGYGGLQSWSYIRLITTNSVLWRVVEIAEIRVCIRHCSLV